MKKILLSMMACAALCACTSDDALVDNTVNGLVEDGVYMKFTLTTSTRATRSATDTDDNADYVTSEDGIENAKDYENTVNMVNIVLATTDTNGEAIVIAEAEAYKTGSSSTNSDYVASFAADEVKEYAGTEVSVIVHCNAYDIVNPFDLDEIYTLDLSAAILPWDKSQFLMSNSGVYMCQLPTNFDNYKNSSTPYNIGTVDVERSVARFDYKDGSDGNYTYPMMVGDNGAEINLVITDVALVNLSNKFYRLRRTAASTAEDETVADYTNTKILGVEYVNNWVIDTDAEEKMNANGSLASNFTYPMQDPSTWVWTSMSEISENDNDDTWNDSGDYGSYNIWRYVTENTIPSVEAQQKGVTTGVVFKARIDATENTSETLAAALAQTADRIYAYNGVLYGTWNDVVEYAKGEGANTAVAAAYYEVLALIAEGTESKEGAEAQAGFTCYSAEADGNYYCYYYYWNRHNDNKNDAEMGIMEFDVVRNNVYKLSVSAINNFGHPTPGSDDPDPDPENPEDPDEEDNLYIEVEVHILPWVVRVNDITF